MRLAFATILVLLAGTATGCGGSRSDLAQVGDRIGDIRSGTLHFSFVVTPRVANAKDPFGFRINGPFAFGSTPTADVRYTQVANGHDATVRLVLGPSGGFVEANGQRRSLTDAQLAELRGAAQSARSGASVDVGGWVKSMTSCGDRCARGRLDVAAAANTLLELEGSKRSLDESESKQLADATRTATYRATWNPDHVLRSLDVHLELGFDVEPQLRAALGDAAGAVIDLNLGLDDPKTR